MSKVRIATSVLLAVLLALPVYAENTPQNIEKGTKMSTQYFQGIDHPLEVAVLANDVIGIENAIKAGADVNARGKANMTPLMLAVDRLHMNAVKTLLSYKANPNLKTDDGYSAVHLAVQNYRKMPEMMDVIFKGGGDPNMRGPNNNPMISHFAIFRDCDAIRYMHRIGADINILTNTKRPLIVQAALADDWDVVWCLLELGAQYDHKDTKGRHSLSVDLNYNKYHSDAPLFKYKKKVWIFLKEHGAKELEPLFDDPDHLGAEIK